MNLPRKDHNHKVHSSQGIKKEETVNKLEMCQYDTHAPAQGHPHPYAGILQKMKLILFVCVEVLRPSQPNGVMSSEVSLPNHTFTGQA